MEDVRIDISGAELVVKVLKSHGVNLIYNLCGSSTSSLIVQAHKAGIRIIDTRNEVTWFIPNCSLLLLDLLDTPC